METETINPPRASSPALEPIASDTKEPSPPSLLQDDSLQPALEDSTVAMDVDNDKPQTPADQTEPTKTNLSDPEYVFESLHVRQANHFLLRSNAVQLSERPKTPSVDMETTSSCAGSPDLEPIASDTKEPSPPSLPQDDSLQPALKDSTVAMDVDDDKPRTPADQTEPTKINGRGINPKYVFESPSCTPS